MDENTFKKLNANINTFSNDIKEGKKTNPKYCRKCNFSENKPENVCCLIYKNIAKPYEVLFEGAECDYYNDMDKNLFREMIDDINEKTDQIIIGYGSQDN